ncbi:hypothetical protein [Lacinutrix sp. Bg11-31]|uniref:hypothetical protein n=1 Tax=Lacinutrix sp. Bg11-31 TaxID=2057808 RepID=UPI000C31849C|nr:hypothetical protein [Lacinutrix sp. Bg11-31]AUC80944.1 hypothetical protein CW733_01860 [Lacinutrix sp. Bg11-31]
MAQKQKSSTEDHLNNLKNDLIIHFYQDAAFYERRTYILFFIISGSGLYACLDLYKNLNENNNIFLLLVTSVFFIIPLILSIISNEIARKKSLYKAEYFQSRDEIDREGAGKYIKIENGLKLTIGTCFLIGITLIAIIYYQNF